MRLAELRNKVRETGINLADLHHKLQRQCTHRKVLATVYTEIGGRKNESRGICLICGLTEGNSDGQLRELTNKPTKWVDNKTFQKYWYLENGKSLMRLEDIQDLFKNH